MMYGILNGQESLVGRMTISGRGEPGVGIETIVQTETSTASGGRNTWTVTLTDGRTSSFYVRNGEKGDTGVSITNVAFKSSSGLVDTYEITFSDGNTTTFNVTNGNGISSIAKTDTSGNVDTYTINYTNGTTSTFTVTNSNVSSVNGQTGDVVLTANEITYDETAAQTSGSIGNEVTNLKTAIDNFDSNLFPDYYPQTFITGIAINASTGAQASFPSYSIAQYFEVTPGSTIKLRNYAVETSTTIGLAFYSTNTPAAYISGVAYSTLGGIDAVVPEGAKYCRFSFLSQMANRVSFSMDMGTLLEEIESKSNTAYNKAEIISLGKNLFDKEKRTPERYLSTTGNPTFNAGFFVTDFIPITADKIYQVSPFFNMWVYDENKTPMHAVTTNAFTAQAGEAFVRVAFKNATLDTAQVEQANYNTKYESYGYKIDKEDINFEPASTEANNWFNSDAVSNGYLNNSGLVERNSNYRTSAFIAVEVGKIYSIYGMWGRVCLYNADGTFMRSFESWFSDHGQTLQMVTFSPQEGEALVKFSMALANVDNVQFEENIGSSKKTEAVSSVVEADRLTIDAHKTTHIYVGANCYYQTINDANNAISDNSPDNRYIIHIMDGEYNETFTTKDYVDYVGINMHRCILNYISDNESDYVNRSTIFAASETRIANLTIRTKGSKYPIHIDANYGKPYHLTIEDCIVIHDGYTDTTIQPGGTGIGIGLHYEQHVTIKRCAISGTAGVFGVASVYCHNDNENQSQERSQRERSLTIENCRLTDSYYGVRWQAIETVDGQDNDFYCIGNVNTCQVPYRYEPGTFDSWHYFGMLNQPEYQPS